MILVALLVCGSVLAVTYWVMLKGTGDRTRDLKNIETSLIDNGWEPVQNNKAVRYRKGDLPITVYVGYYKSDTDRTDHDILELVKEGIIEAPSTQEYIYGVKVSATYYSCTNESFLDLKACPPPPSEPTP